MNIVLCGMMGSGKTTVGIRISELTGMRWYDTDDLITQKYGKISDIFEFYGEARFRELESEIVHAACSNRKTASRSSRAAERSSF